MGNKIKHSERIEFGLSKMGKERFIFILGILLISIFTLSFVVGATTGGFAGGSTGGFMGGAVQSFGNPFGGAQTSSPSFGDSVYTSEQRYSYWPILKDMESES